MKATYIMLLATVVSLASCSDSYNGYEDYAGESATATFAISAANRFGISVTSRAGEDSTEVAADDTPVDPTVPEGISDIKYVISDGEGRIIDHHHARMSSDLSSLTVEGLKSGSYSIMFLGSGVDGWTADPANPQNASEAWLTNGRDNSPVNSLYYHKKVDFSIGMDHAPVNETVELELAVARVDVSVVMHNLSLWRHIRKVSLTINDAIPTGMNADGTYSGEHTVTDFDLTEPLRDISFTVFPSERPVSGYVEVVSSIDGGADFTTRYPFEGLRIERGKISRIELAYRHPEANSGRIHITEEQIPRFKPDTMFMSDEPQAVFYNNSLRYFNVNEPLQLTVTAEGKLGVKLYSPIGIRNVRVLGRLRNVSSEWFDLAYFDYVPPFAEAAYPLPLTGHESRFTTATGRNICVPAMPALSAADLEMKIETEDPFMAKIAKIDSKWLVRFAKYSADSENPGNWRHMTPILCRHAVALMLNMAFMFSSPEFSEHLDTYDGILLDNNGNAIDLDALRVKIRNYSRFTMGAVGGVGGLGSSNGGYGLANYCYTGVYHDLTPEGSSPHNYPREAMFHELGHCLGYNHNSNMTYGAKWTVLCATVFVQLGREGKLPVPNSTDVTSLPYNR